MLPESYNFFLTCLVIPGHMAYLLIYTIYHYLNRRCLNANR